MSWGTTTVWATALGGAVARMGSRWGVAARGRGGVVRAVRPHDLDRGEKLTDSQIQNQWFTYMRKPGGA
ncbi:hypothetical protein GCM10010271_58680 [Streptomyces kurssanovii]|nr:hypothetical protein GCM10010271_58680 [Streptomyces kurssanovii]